MVRIHDPVSEQTDKGTKTLAQTPQPEMAIKRKSAANRVYTRHEAVWGRLQRHFVVAA